MMQHQIDQHPVVQGLVDHDEVGASRAPGNQPRSSRASGIAVVVGTAGIDAYHQTGNLMMTPGSVGIDGPSGREFIPHSGTGLEPGGEANAAVDLGPIMARLGATRRIAGAGPGTARELCAVRDRGALSLEVLLADTSNRSPELDNESRDMRAGYAALNLGPMARRLVLGSATGGRALRTILREPPAGLAALNGEWRDLEAAAGDRLKLVVINSVAADEVAVAAVRAARQHTALVVSVLTPSTSLECRIDSLLAGSGVALADVGEFRDLAAGLGVGCPPEEHFTAIPRIAGALRAVVERTPTGGDVVVTVGECGQVIYDAENRVIFHLGLTPEARTVCRNYPPCGPAERHRRHLRRESGGSLGLAANDRKRGGADDSPGTVRLVRTAGRIESPVPASPGSLV